VLASFSAELGKRAERRRGEVEGERWAAAAAAEEDRRTRARFGGKSRLALEVLSRST